MPSGNFFSWDSSNKIGSNVFLSVYIKCFLTLLLCVLNLKLVNVAAKSDIMFVEVSMIAAVLSERKG